MLRWFYIFFSILLVVGCSSEKEGMLYNKIDYNRNLKYTEKVDIFEDKDIKITLSATYILDKKSFGKDTNENEKFIVSILSNDLDDTDISINNNSLGFKLTLNGKNPLDVVKLKKSDKILSKIPFITKWSDIYKVSFSHSNSNMLTLVFSNSKYGTKKMLFSKVAKYTYSKKLFLGNNSIF